MAIGIVSREEFDREFGRSTGQKNARRTEQIESHQKETVTIKESHTPEHGRKAGDVNVPEPMRKLIGEEYVINGRRSGIELARSLGVSDSSASAYANGATSTKTYDTPNKELLGHINKSRRRAIGKASRTLNAALSAVTQEKLDYTDAKDLSIIAKNMSAIIKDLEPQKEVEKDSTGASVQFTIFAPQFRQELDFDVIDVKE